VILVDAGATAAYKRSGGSSLSQGRRAQTCSVQSRAGLVSAMRFCDVACVLRPALFLEVVSEFGHVGCMEVGALFSLTKEKAVLIFLLSEAAYDSF
jgi:hypothetical protein